MRSYDNSMDEEINRIIADRLSNYLFCPTKNSRINLLREAYPNNICKKTKQKLYFVGDLMYDLFKKINTNSIIHYLKKNLII